MRDDLREKLVDQLPKITIVGSSIETTSGTDPETGFEESGDDS